MFRRSHRRLLALVMGSLALGAWAADVAVPVPAVPQPAPSRGQLLYATHCLDCHTAQIHWRERKLARDWPTLRAQVDRWQAQAHLGWSDDDIDAVAHYLNRTSYGFAAPVVSSRGRL